MTVYGDDDELLRQFLTKPPEDCCEFYGERLYADRTSVCTRRGGWHLLINGGRGRPYRLGLDRPLDYGRDTAANWRRRVMEAAATVKASVLPVANGSYVAAQRDNPDTPIPRVVTVNDSFESVFAFGERYYLSGYDTQEEPPLYFLCRLPGPVATIDEARESLKPASVRLALAAGIGVVRQGDIFAIESNLNKPALKRLGASFCHDKPIYGTAHTSPDLARLPGGTMLAKKVLLHEPTLIASNRTADHAPRELPSKRWWWLTRNTVPVRWP